MANRRIHGLVTLWVILVITQPTHATRTTRGIVKRAGAAEPATVVALEQVSLMTKPLVFNPTLLTTRLTQEDTLEALHETAPSVSESAPKAKATSVAPAATAKATSNATGASDAIVHEDKGHFPRGHGGHLVIDPTEGIEDVTASPTTPSTTDGGPSKEAADWSESLVEPLKAPVNASGSAAEKGTSPNPAGAKKSNEPVDKEPTDAKAAAKESAAQEATTDAKKGAVNASVVKEATPAAKAVVAVAAAVNATRGAAEKEEKAKSTVEKVKADKDAAVKAVMTEVVNVVHSSVTASKEVNEPTKATTNATAAAAKENATATTIDGALDEGLAVPPLPKKVETPSIDLAMDTATVVELVDKTHDLVAEIAPPARPPGAASKANGEEDQAEAAVTPVAKGTLAAKVVAKAVPLVSLAEFEAVPSAKEEGRHRAKPKGEEGKQRAKKISDVDKEAASANKTAAEGDNNVAAAKKEAKKEANKKTALFEPKATNESSNVLAAAVPTTQAGKDAPSPPPPVAPPKATAGLPPLQPKTRPPITLQPSPPKSEIHVPARYRHAAAVTTHSTPGVVATHATPGALGAGGTHPTPGAGAAAFKAAAAAAESKPRRHVDQTDALHPHHEDPTGHPDLQHDEEDEWVTANTANHDPPVAGKDWLPHPKAEATTPPPPPPPPPPVPHAAEPHAGTKGPTPTGTTRHPANYGLLFFALLGLLLLRTIARYRSDTLLPYMDI